MPVWKDGVKQGAGSLLLPDKYADLSVGSFLTGEHSPVLRLPLNGNLVDIGSGGKTFSKLATPLDIVDRDLPPDGSYLNCNGGQYIYLSPADSVPYHTTGDLTVVIRARLHIAASIYQTMFGFRDGDYGANYQWWGFYGSTLHYWQGGQLQFAVGTVGRLKEWCVYVFVRESNKHRVYRDGVQIGAESAAIPVPSSTVEGVCIGGRPNADWSYADFSQVALYHTALNAAQVEALTSVLKP
ncbi:MAG: hypothetical protein CL920_32705 [Deltaproteobacteria bacterium]|nr:hypothetical protein [Deltaproteobacteria bacterium]MBU53482.1 hypothetical protein [Deltaproteobacteria bacterium]|tara:strand:- start:7093 stop:7812 length:720 start_codon:yes stop_codon:yes gene_type:complete